VYDEALSQSFVWKDLQEVRNMRQAFGRGFWMGGALAGMMTATKGRFPPGNTRIEPDTEQELIRTDRAKSYPAPDGKLTFDKLSSVFASGNATRDDAPNHIRVSNPVAREVAQAWVSMCPAQVYEIPEDQLSNGAAEVRFNITPSNCVQCGAITAKGGRLTPPEGGDGPLYQET
jgi:electron-transferring-flavoprotein dehydrogenase